MIAQREEASITVDREIVITRLLAAPRALVFRAWTEPEHLGHWYGPRGFTITTSAIDIRPGGAWRFIMHGPDGVDYPNRIIYQEIVPVERLVYVHDDDDAHTMEPFQTVVTFAAEGNATRLTLRNIFVSAEERDRVVREHGAIEGGNQTLDRLAEHLVTMG